MSPRSDTGLDFAVHVDFSQILTNPILDIAARVWENDRYQAFRVCYRSMRVVDDLVDNRKSEPGELTRDESSELEKTLLDWSERLEQHRFEDPFGQTLLATIDRFAIPVWPWRRLCRAMIYDLHHDGFPTLPAFLRYTEGAAIAPASIFTHLCGVVPADNGYQPPAYDIRWGARDLAVFSYLVHILRDFEKDLQAGLYYFADEQIHRAGTSRTELRSVALGAEPSAPVRRLVAEYQRIARWYQNRARRTVDNLRPRLTPQYQLSLEIIYQLYSQILERIDPLHGEFTAGATNPSPEAVQHRLSATIKAFTPTT